MTTDPQTARDNLIGYCLVASPNEVTLERAERLADAYRDAVLAVPSAPVDRAAVLTAAERQFLTFALDLAADRMASRGDEFNSDDEAALEKLRRRADEEQPS